MFNFFKFTLIEIILLLIAIVLLFVCITFTFDGLICFNCMIAGIYNWQTLIAGVIALGGALITVYYLNKQYRLESEAKKIQVRASLNSEINNFSLYSRECLDFIREIRVDIPDKSLTDKGINLVAENIAYNDKETAEFLEQFTIFYQLHNARLYRYKKNNKKTTGDFEFILRTVLEFRHLTSDLISYVRNNNIRKLNENPNDTDLLAAGRDFLHYSSPSFDLNTIEELINFLRPPSLDDAPKLDLLVT